MTEEYPEVSCPKCGATQTDFDGFGVLYCEECKYCSHPAISDGVCELCGMVDGGSTEDLK